jgi:hypothetical protein
MYRLAAVKTRLPLTVSVPTELPGERVPPARIVVGPTVPLPERAAEIDEYLRGGDRAVHAQGAGVDEGRTGIGVHRGEDCLAAAELHDLTPT